MHSEVSGPTTSDQAEPNESDFSEPCRWTPSGCGAVAAVWLLAAQPPPLLTPTLTAHPEHLQREGQPMSEGLAEGTRDCGMQG